jgi:hypothetical protein
MKTEKAKPKYVICVNNEGYLASLELRKIYRVLPDDSAQEHRYLRVIDESGDSYLYPADFFIPIELPHAAERIFSLTT